MFKAIYSENLNLLSATEGSGKRSMKKILKGTAVLYSAIDVLAKITQFLFFPLLAQFLTIEQLAILSFYLIAVNAAQPISVSYTHLTLPTTPYV